jgi:hypothetical protein
MKKDDSIPNWTFFGARTIKIDTHEVEVDGEIRYNPCITFELDDGTEDSEKVVCMFTDHFCDDPQKSIYETAFALGGLFGQISASTSLIGLDGEIKEEYDLNNDFDFFEEEWENEPVKMTKNKIVLH